MIGLTTSLCEHCYRHVPARVYVKDSSVWISKTCSEHSVSEYMIERDAEFYLGLDFNNRDTGRGVLIEVTDRCNLACPHCYHQPESQSQDRAQELILAQIASWPRDVDTVILAGAEPTLRRDLPELIKAISDQQQALAITDQRISILSNGIRFADLEWCKQLRVSGLKIAMIGLNHRSYQGDSVHAKQLQGIINCRDAGIYLQYIGYTLSDSKDLRDVLEEIQSIHVPNRGMGQYRIRLGSDIGRSPEEDRVYLSDTVRAVHSIVKEKNWSWEPMVADNNLYHYMVKINGITHRLIQWCDVKSIDLEELRTGPWCDFVPNKPISNFLHQVILRDASVNQSLNLWDTVPRRYRYRSRNEIALDTSYTKHYSSERPAKPTVDS